MCGIIAVVRPASAGAVLGRDPRPARAAPPGCWPTVGAATSRRGSSIAAEPSETPTGCCRRARGPGAARPTASLGPGARRAARRRRAQVADASRPTSTHGAALRSPDLERSTPRSSGSKDAAWASARPAAHRPGGRRAGRARRRRRRHRGVHVGPARAVGPRPPRGPGPRLGRPPHPRPRPRPRPRRRRPIAALLGAASTTRSSRPTRSAPRRAL